MIKVRSKTLFVPAEEQSIGASGEAESTVREFHIDRVSGDGVDLANLLFKLNIRYAGVREIDRSDLEKVVTDNAIILRWLISSVTLRNAGTAFLQLDAFDETGSCRWKSYPGAVYIEKSIGTEDVPKSSLSELEQLEKKFSKLDAQEEERKTAEEKRVTAEGKREEAETRRNASLSNIVAEEAKIVALSNETKGYRDSVASDKAQVSELKQNADALKVAMEQKITTATTDFNEKLSSVNSLTVEVREKTNTVASLTAEVKEKANAVSSATEEVKGIRTALNSLKSDTQTIADRARTDIQGAVASATDSMTKAKASADSAKDSEIKTLEALKKAQEGGKVAGVTSDEMHSYVDNAVANIHSGLTAEEVKQSAKAVIQENTLQVDEAYRKTIEDLIFKGDGTWNIPENKLLTTEAIKEVNEQVAIYLEEQRRKQETPYRDIVDLYDMQGASTLDVIKEIKRRIKKNSYGDIRLGDYIDIQFNGKKYPMRFEVVGIDCMYELDRSTLAPGNVFSAPKHIDFCCLNTGIILNLPAESYIPYREVKDQYAGAFNLIHSEVYMDIINKNTELIGQFHQTPLSSVLGKYYLDAYLWMPTAVNILGEIAEKDNKYTNTLEAGYNFVPMLQYPYFKEHRGKIFPGAYILPRRNGNMIDYIDFHLLHYSDESVAEFSYSVLQEIDDKVIGKGGPDTGRKPEVPICFRLTGD